jgi:conjugative relaxase-like TrwC/TraI family protein
MTLVRQVDLGEPVTIVTPRSGYDPEYYLERAQGERSAGGYYISPAQHGEAAGRWFGRGAEHLGFREGQQVTEEPYLKVYAQVDPRTGEKLGGSPRGYAHYYKILGEKLAAEPHATQERVMELEREAAKETRRSPVYTDMTLAHNKSVSVLHAAFREQARRARLAGDHQAERLWTAREERVQEILQEANHAALEWMQDHAGYVRRGYHGRKVDGVEPGRWERAKIVVATFLQGTSRDGDPHDHSHNVVARVALSESDGIWRAVDTMALRQQTGAMAAIAESRVRSALSREFGVAWARRDDGRGYEIEGITQEELDAYSTRTRAVTQKARELARAWEDKYGRAPNAREMLFIGDHANQLTRGNKAAELIDWDKLARRWDRVIGGRLAGIAERVCRFGRAGREKAPSAEMQQQTMELALASVQAMHSTWTRSELMRHLAWMMGPEFDAMTPASREAMLHTLTDQALSVQQGVICLEAPEWPAPPPQLIRDLDGRSVFTRPGTTRYACKGQLGMEEKLCQQAQAQGAPALTLEFAAAQLGAEAEALDAILRERAQDATQVTQRGLRMDQAAMIYQALTSRQRMSVGVGPAGSGKTHTAAAGARAWQASGGHVIGLTCSQAARNVLERAGIWDSWNTARFFGRLDAGKITISPGTLFVIDEGSMMSMTDIADIVDLAEQTGGKVFLTGDHAQLTAVESGGGMMLAAKRLGFTQLSEPVRFREEWERDASLRLRLGDQTALEDYNEHGRITGAGREQVFGQARRAYVAGRLAGDDMLLMAYTRDDCRELSRQIRDDLVHLGLVDHGPTVKIAYGARASVGDLIVARDNDRELITDIGPDGAEHDLANGDIFRVEAIRENGIMVRRVLEASEDGSPRFADHAVLYGHRNLATTDLAYAVTGHNGQGGTVSRGLALITGRESLQWLYVALTRGRQRNTAMAVTHEGVKETPEGEEAMPQRAADPAPGTRPDPELARAERVERERAGLPPEAEEQPLHDREPIAILADAMERDDSEESASEYQRRQLANADHLGVLHARWTDLIRKADRERYHQMIQAALPEEHRGEVGSVETWINRCLRTAEAAGLDPGELLRNVIGSRTLDGARDVGKVIYGRLHRITDGLVPEPEKPFAERVPQVDDPEIQEYLGQLGPAQDERRERLGEHAAEISEPWAVKALGPVPEDPLERLGWEHRAGWVCSYRERFGINGQKDPIGVEPTNNAPEMRAAWHRAFAAMSGTEEINFRELPDRSLVFMAESYRNETSWAPPHVGRQLRDVRLGRETMRLQRIRAEAEAENAGDQRVAERHRGLASQARVLEVLYEGHEKVLAEAQADRETWERFTAGPREVAVHAQAELQRRFPKQKMTPLQSAEPRTPEEGLWRPGWMQELEQQRAAFREELERRQGLELPDEDPDVKGREAWPVWRAQKEAILQPPQPEIRPAEKVLEKVRDGERGG